MSAPALLVISLTFTFTKSPLCFARDLFITNGNITQSIKGRNVTITCQGSFQDPTELTWYKNQQPVKSARVTTTGSNYTWTLTITDVHLQDSGHYTCKSKTGHASTRLIVDVAPSVQVSVDPPTATLQDGKSALLSCDVSGKPKPTACWKVTNGEHDHVELHSRHQGNTIIISANESGIYTCKAFNRAGRMRQSIALLSYNQTDYHQHQHGLSPLLPSPTAEEEEEGTYGAPVGLILVVLGCFVVFVFLVFMCYTLGKLCCSPLCTGGITFLKNSLGRQGSPHSTSPRLELRVDKIQALTVSRKHSGLSSQRNRENSALSGDAQSKSPEENESLGSKFVADKHVDKPSQEPGARRIKETAV